MRPRASLPSIDKLRPQKANELCVSLGLGQFLDRIAVQKEDRKLEPCFGFSSFSYPVRPCLFCAPRPVLSCTTPGNRGQLVQRARQARHFWARFFWRGACGFICRLMSPLAELNLDVLQSDYLLRRN